MDIVIITGMSGAGKSTTLDIFEDMGYYAIDNLPPALIIKIAELSRDSHKAIEKLAVVVDIRGEKFFDDLIKAVIDLKDSGENVSLLYLDSKDEILVRRYKELRRPHPLSKSGNTLIGIAKEREALKDIREMVDNFIDTTGLTIGELKSRVMALYGQNEEDRKLHISVVSFGFKNGILLDGDLVFDVRFLPNPYYIKELKNKSGNDKEVYDYVMKFEDSKLFVDKIIDLLEFLIPRYEKEGKTNIVVGIGCTGGQHRSVAIANEISKRLRELGEITYVNNRDSKYW